MDWKDCPHPLDLGPTPMQQHPFYGRACAAMGSGVVSVGLGPSHAPLATAQILIRRWPLFGDFALIARGPVWAEDVTEPEARLALRRLVAMLRARCRWVIVTPERRAGVDLIEGQGLLPLLTAGSQARLSLTGTAAERMARQHGKWRNRLRRAQRTDLRVCHGPLPVDPTHWLLRAEAAQSRSRGYRRLPARFSLAWAEVNGKTSTRLFWTEQRGAPVAGMLFLLHGTSATYHVGWTSDAARHDNAHTLLLWEASNWLAARGFSWVDLGTLDTETTPGLARFKLGSGASPVQLGHTWMEAPGARTVARLFQPTRRPTPQLGAERMS